LGRHSENKDDVLREISELTGTPFFPTARGGTVTREFVDEIAHFFGVDNSGNKLEILSACLGAVGLPWRPQYDSSRSNSGGGGTITFYGLIALRNAAIDFISGNEHLETSVPIAEISGALVDYVPASEFYPHEGEFEPGQIDPDLLGDGFERHNKTQNSLAQYLGLKGVRVFSPKAGEPKYDLFWIGESGSYVCEVKSITEENEESQMRKAVGQVLRYQSQLIVLGKQCAPVIVTDRRLSDDSWEHVCQMNGISLGYGPDFLGLEDLS